MERRTKNIIAGVLFFLIGIPLFYFIQLARGFGSCSGDYYKITGASTKFLEFQDSLNDGTLQFVKAIKLDSAKNYAFYIRFHTEYYTQIKNSSSGLYAAHAPGHEGSKEKIDSLSAYLVDIKTHAKININSKIELWNGLNLINSERYNGLYQEVQIKDSTKINAYVFKNLIDLKNSFNSSRGTLFNFMLDDTPLLFFLNKEIYNSIDSSFNFYLYMKMSDGRVITSSNKE